ncbi:TlpA family protein disulfide reductase [Moheibacter sp.]|uniref:TlpA family protein disulfide reductase n=1 Tax=Moheibacter sp. TaxID=1965316 RepID=UPI003C78AC2E
MKFRFFSALIVLVLIWNCDSKKEEIEVGSITERSPEELASFVEYAPSFTFNSIQGNQISLSDLKGKYLYVDVWATWCRPCLQQLPAMKELEEKYRDTNIEFVSISVDNDRDKAKWQKMVQEKQMGGVQLFAGKRTSFHQDYKISTIPKFLLIGKDGEIIDDNAPRPMDYATGGINQQLVTVFEDLLKK